MSETHGSEEIEDLWQRCLVVDDVGAGVHVQGKVLGGREGGRGENDSLY